MSSTETTVHLLVYPFMSSGHIIPLLDLASNLLDRGVTVTVAVTIDTLHLLDPLRSRHVFPLLLPQPEMPPHSFTGNRLFAVIQSFRDRHGPLVKDWFRSHPSPPAAILSDFFFGWTNDLASELGIKRVVFSPSGALAFAVGARTWLDRPRCLLPEETVTFPKIPNSPSYPWRQISYLYRSSDEGEPDFDFYLENQLANLSSWGIVFNSFAGLEKEYIDHVKNDYGYEETRVWAVGPTLPDEAASRGGSSSVGCPELMTWLDSKPEGSVLYVCFGSRFALNRRQAEALAVGLERSGAHFIWCVRGPTMGGGGELWELPLGFEDRVKGRGLIIKGWAPQVVILRHPAVGSFVTHCGWNSVVEGVAAGVAMLTWPMAADQFANSDILVDGIGVGVRVGEAEVRVPSPEEVVTAVATAEGEGLRANAKAAGELARRAVAEGGSSYVDLDRFVKELNGLQVKPKNGLY